METRREAPMHEPLISARERWWLKIVVLAVVAGAIYAGGRALLDAALPPSHQHYYFALGYTAAWFYGLGAAIHHRGYPDR